MAGSCDAPATAKRSCCTSPPQPRTKRSCCTSSAAYQSMPNNYRSLRGRRARMREQLRSAHREPRRIHKLAMNHGTAPSQRRAQPAVSELSCMSVLSCRTRSSRLYRSSRSSRSKNENNYYGSQAGNENRTRYPLGSQPRAVSCFIAGSGPPPMGATVGPLGTGKPA